MFEPVAETASVTHPVPDPLVRAAACQPVPSQLQLGVRAQKPPRISIGTS